MPFGQRVIASADSPVYERAVFPSGDHTVSRLHVPRRWLLILAGITWFAVGLMLCCRAWGWLNTESPNRTWMEELGAGATGFFLYSFALSKVAQKNIDRIGDLPHRTHAWNFIPMKSYLMIAAMIGMGIMLRNSSLPKELLIIPYTAMGGALILGGVLYLRSFFGPQSR